VDPLDCLIDGPDDPRAVLVLAHGAGAPMDHDWMNAVAARFSAAGVTTLRFEFPYMARRRVTGKRGGPDRAEVLTASFLEAAALGASLAGGTERLFLGGKSMGGRYATYLVDKIEAAGCVVFGYPFHPPGRPPTEQRLAHLATLASPTLILQGERDAFGDRIEVPGYKFSRRARVQFVPAGDHSLKPTKASGRTLEQNLDDAVAAAAAFMR
jgi:predicted alpha/beta-hydrolase family hydrolase